MYGVAIASLGMLGTLVVALTIDAYGRVADNAGGYLMQQGLVDVCIVGTDRTTANGDVGNKIGTYLKGLAAHDNGVPFYAAVPSPSIDFAVNEPGQIPIEERSGDEVRWMHGKTATGQAGKIQIIPDATRVSNPAFDVTPRHLMTGLITERGVCAANGPALAAMFPERPATGH